MASADNSAPAPDLAGGPPGDMASRPPEPVTSMAPIANPEDMSPEERERIYGHRYDSMAPAFTRRVRHYRQHGYWRPRAIYYKLAHRPRRHGGALTAKTLAPAASTALKPAITAAPTPAPTPAPTKAADRLTQLQSKLAGPIAQGAVLATADDLAAGKPGAVTLSLPATLLSQLRTEAAKLDLAQSASRVEIHATLTGDGYTITPSGDQIGHPQFNQPLNFTWQAQPIAGAVAGPLKAQVVAQLHGAGATKNVPLLSLEKSITSPAANTATAAPQPDQGGLEALNAKLGFINLPGLGKVAIGFLLAVGLLILVGLALAMAARQQAERESERRRKARAMAAARFDEQVEAARASAPFPAPVTAAEAKKAQEVKKPETV